MKFFLLHRKLQSLEEEHNDLLELLGQQSLELTVFKEAIQQKLGENELRSIRESAQQCVINQYGAYIDRKELLEGMINTLASHCQFILP
eukprot:gene14967-20135_t